MGGDEGLQQQVHAGDEAGDDHDEAGDTDLIGDDLAQQRDENVGKGASWEFHWFSTASTAFQRVARSANPGGAWDGSMISAWTSSFFLL